MRIRRVRCLVTALKGKRFSGDAEVGSPVAMPKLRCRVQGVAGGLEEDHECHPRILPMPEMRIVCYGMGIW